MSFANDVLRIQIFFFQRKFDLFLNQPSLRVDFRGNNGKVQISENIGINKIKV